MSPEALRALLIGSRRDRGRFAAFFAAESVTVAPVILADAPSRLTGALVHTEILPTPGPVGRGWALRLATAIRQDLWRAFQNRRGVAPVVVVRLTPRGAEVHAAAAFLDDATAAPGSVDVLRRLFHDDSRRRWLDWAGGARTAPAAAPGRGAPTCSTRS